MAWSAVAWWPGGRWATKPTPSPASLSASTAARAPPAASRAVSQEPALAMVSKSSEPPPEVAEVLQGAEVLGGVHPAQLVLRGSPRCQGHDGVRQVGPADALQDSLYPARAFGVGRARLMVVQLRRRTQVEHG